MPPTPVPETLAALRLATAAAHEAIDRQLQLGADLPLGRYVRILQGFEAYLAAWEPRVAAALPASARGWFAERSRLGLVRGDLAALGRPLLGHAEGPPALPALDGPAGAFGSLYVMEGSALGGQLIARRAADRFGFDAAHGAAYFHGFGERTGALWRDFRDRLEAAVAPGERATAAAAAVATFDSLRDHFHSVLHDVPTAA